MKNVIVLIPLFLAHQLSLTEAVECTASCVGQAPGSFVPDPQDCHNYYGCLDDGNTTDVPFTCSEGSYWQGSSCSYEFDPCIPDCPAPGCSITCHEDMDLLAYPGDCTKYRVCTPASGVQEGYCPSDRPYFDGVECQTDSSLCCDACEVRCNYAGTEIVDPFNCTNYYFCQDFYTPVSVSCSSGMWFDGEQGKCVPLEDVHCENVCDYDGGETTAYPKSTTPYYNGSNETYTTTTPYYNGSNETYATTTPYYNGSITEIYTTTYPYYNGSTEKYTTTTTTYPTSTTTITTTTNYPQKTVIKDMEKEINSHSKSKRLTKKSKSARNNRKTSKKLGK